MKIKINHGTGKDSIEVLSVLSERDKLIDLNEIFQKVIKHDKIWRMEVYEK